MHEQGTGAALLGYTKLYGQVAGGQAEYLRVPQAQYGPIKVPDGPPDEQFLFLSDVLPTAWQAVEYARIPERWFGGRDRARARSGRCAPGSPAIAARRVFGVDLVAERLEMARRHGIETLDLLEHKDLAGALRDLTDGRGPDSVIDAVGMEAHGSQGVEGDAGVRRAPARRGRGADDAERAGVDRLAGLLSCIDIVRRGGTSRSAACTAARSTRCR